MKILPCTTCKGNKVEAKMLFYFIFVTSTKFRALFNSMRLDRVRCKKRTKLILEEEVKKERLSSEEIKIKETKLKCKIPLDGTVKIGNGDNISCTFRVKVNLLCYSVFIIPSSKASILSPNPLFYLVEYGNFDFLFTEFIALSS